MVLIAEYKEYKASIIDDKLVVHDGIDKPVPLTNFPEEAVVRRYYYDEPFHDIYFATDRGLYCINLYFLARGDERAYEYYDEPVKDVCVRGYLLYIVTDDRKLIRIFGDGTEEGSVVVTAENIDSVDFSDLDCISYTSQGATVCKCDDGGMIFPTRVPI